jgi:MFS family permease
MFANASGAGGAAGLALERSILQSDMVPLAPLLPLLSAAFILLAGNGLQGTLIALRAAHEGFDPALVGFMGTGYFAGYIVSCLVTARFIRAVGHIRVFAALAATAAAGTLMLVLWVDPYVWILLRFGMGFCFAGLFMVIESWLNAHAASTDRGRVLSIYRIIDLAAVTGAQFLLPVFGPSGFTLFAIMAMMACLSLVPVSLADRSNPKPPDEFKFSLGSIWAISPLACLGCVTIGLTNSAFRLIGPLFGQIMGLDTAGVALFIAAGIVGGATLQLPLGWLSDRYDRRWVLIAATTGASLAGLFLSQVAGSSQFLLTVGIFFFGAFSLPLYSLSAAHANDRANPGQYVIVAAGLTFFFSLGAAVGPVVVAWVMATFGASAFFAYTSIVHAILVVITLWRMAARSGPSRSPGNRFVTLLRTSPAIFKLARRGGNGELGQRPAGAQTDVRHRDVRHRDE